MFALKPLGRYKYPLPPIFLSLLLSSFFFLHPSPSTSLLPPSSFLLPPSSFLSFSFLVLYLPPEVSFRSLFNILMLLSSDRFILMTL
ncbi:hypothetical protein ACN38_g6496, partial [Penicillium nordicum]